MLYRSEENESHPDRKVDKTTPCTWFPGVKTYTIFWLIPQTPRKPSPASHPKFNLKKIHSQITQTQNPKYNPKNESNNDWR
jgi:hypothetical protein